MLDRPYSPYNWYWTHADGRVFGSARSGFVQTPQSDAAFASWKAAGGVATPWPLDDAGEASDDALRAVLAPYSLYLTRKDALTAAVNAKRDALVAGGYQHNFGGSAGVRTLDQRGPEDDAAWFRRKSAAADLIAAGEGTSMVDVIDASNAVFSASADTVNRAIAAMFAWRDAMQMKARTLKNEIAAAEDPDAIDINADWPE